MFLLTASLAMPVNLCMICKVNQSLFNMFLKEGSYIVLASDLFVLHVTWCELNGQISGFIEFVELFIDCIKE